MDLNTEGLKEILPLIKKFEKICCVDEKNVNNMLWIKHHKPVKFEKYQKVFDMFGAWDFIDDWMIDMNNIKNTGLNVKYKKKLGKNLKCKELDKIIEYEINIFFIFNYLEEDNLRNTNMLFSLFLKDRNKFDEVINIAQKYINLGKVNMYTKYMII